MSNNLWRNRRKRFLNYILFVVALVIVVCSLIFWQVNSSFNDCLTIKNEVLFQQMLISLIVGILLPIVGACIVIYLIFKRAKEDNMVDHITGLYTSVKFREDLQKIDKNHTECYIYACDINNLKCINDTYGHDVGDYVIETFANQLNAFSHKNPKAFVYRLYFTGDEFAIIIHCSRKEIDTYKRQLSDIFESQIIIEAKEGPKQIPLSVSYGSIYYYRDDGADAKILSAEDAYRIADTRMLKLKKDKKCNSS